VSTSSMILEFKGCKSRTPINMTSCTGFCGTFTYYSLKTHSLQHSCSCCREVTTTIRKVALLCPDYSVIPYTYTHIEACACLKTFCPVLGHPLPITNNSTNLRPFTRALRGK
uniref:CTCK domain-containing protein n=2 Tax=Periophthalmus magnuspinnatus TaxID=409849 RepID=A0A3B3ZXT1_9GOBI